MADQRSKDMPAFNFASQRFVYRRLAQSVSVSFPAFSSFIREYLDPGFEADQGAQYVDDIIIAANNPKQILRNLKAVLASIQTAEEN